MKEVATCDTVGIFAGKSWGGKHALCVRLITVGKVAVCKKKEAYKNIQDLIYMHSICISRGLWFTTQIRNFFVFQLIPVPKVSLKLASFYLSFTFNESNF